MTRRLETLGTKLLSLFVRKIDVGACGSVTTKYYSSCWQCDTSPFSCGYWARCKAYCRSGCGCEVVTCYC